MHSVELHDSYKNCFAQLDQTAKADVSTIVACLGRDCHYLPVDDSLYLCTREGDSASCRKVADDWQLFWYFEYSEYLTSKVETVVLELQRAPLDIHDLHPRRRPLSTGIVETIQAVTRW